MSLLLVFQFLQSCLRPCHMCRPPRSRRRSTTTGTLLTTPNHPIQPRPTRPLRSITVSVEDLVGYARMLISFRAIKLVGSLLPTAAVSLIYC